MDSGPPSIVALTATLQFGVSFSDSLLVVALGVGAVLSTIVAIVSLLAFLRRRTVSYLLITVACSTFLGKTVAGIASLTGSMNPEMHHSFEHSLDVIMIGLVLVAVYYARSGERSKIDTP
jgi:hypothetical protein